MCWEASNAQPAFQGHTQIKPTRLSVQVTEQTLIIKIKRLINIGHNGRDNGVHIPGRPIKFGLEER